MARRRRRRRRVVPCRFWWDGVRPCRRAARLRVDPTAARVPGPTAVALARAGGPRSGRRRTVRGGRAPGSRPVAVGVDLDRSLVQIGNGATGDPALDGGVNDRRRTGDVAKHSLGGHGTVGRDGDRVADDGLGFDNLVDFGDGRGCDCDADGLCGRDGHHNHALVADSNLKLALGGKINVGGLQDDGVQARVHLVVCEVAAMLAMIIQNKMRGVEDPPFRRLLAVVGLRLNIVAGILVATGVDEDGRNKAVLAALKHGVERKGQVRAAVNQIGAAIRVVEAQGAAVLGNDIGRKEQCREWQQKGKACHGVVVSSVDRGDRGGRDRKSERKKKFQRKRDVHLEPRLFISLYLRKQHLLIVSSDGHGQWSPASSSSSNAKTKYTTWPCMQMRQY